LPLLARSHLAQDDNARVDADARLKTHRAARGPWRWEPLYSSHEVEPRGDCVHGVVSLRVRVPEVGEDTVAVVLGDVAVEALDHPGARRVILGDEIGKVLGVELLAESCRFDEIAEDDGQMPALGARQRLVFFGDDLRCYGSPPTCSERSGACTGSFRSLSHVFRFTKRRLGPWRTNEAVGTG
jgi:hypothetical protein